MNEKIIDLHVHTKFSDGFDTVEMAMRKAGDNNVGIISFADHYNMAASYVARDMRKGIEVIPGIELDADMSNYNGKKKHICHILGYFVSFDICKRLDEYEKNRGNNVMQILEILKRRRVNITSQDVIYNAADKNNIGRYDVAQALSYLGYARCPVEAYGLYLDSLCKYCVDRISIPPKAVIELIIECGGVPVLAHPKSLNFGTTREKDFISRLVEYGLRGIEVYNSSNTPKQREYYLRICEKHHLLATVGSDYHGGRRKPEILIGLGIDNNLRISNKDIVEKLKLEKAKIDELNRGSKE